MLKRYQPTIQKHVLITACSRHRHHHYHPQQQHDLLIISIWSGGTGELHQGFRMHKVGRFELQLRWQVGSGIENRILLEEIRFSFPHPCHLEEDKKVQIWVKIGARRAGDPTQQENMIMGTKIPAHDYSIRQFRGLRTLQKKCLGKWLVQVV